MTEDRVAAMEIVDALERRGVKCWITPRDVRPGRFDDQISDAIDHCSALLLIFSDRCNDSDYIYREVTVAGEAKKPVLPLRIEDCLPRRGLRLRLMDIHWIDAFAARQEAIEAIIRTVGTAEEVAGQGVGEPDDAATERQSDVTASAGRTPLPVVDLAGDEAPATTSDPSLGAAPVDVGTATLDPEASKPTPAIRSAVSNGLGNAADEGRSPSTRPKPAPSAGRSFDLGFILAATDGRSTRSQWWTGLVVLAAIAAVLASLVAWAYGPTQTALIVALALQLFLIFPCYALSAKRFQDRGKPGALGLIGIALGIVVTLTRLAGLTNPTPVTALDWALVAALLIVGIWYLIELGCLRGTVGRNAYGPDPLEQR